MMNRINKYNLPPKLIDGPCFNDALKSKPVDCCWPNAFGATLPEDPNTDAAPADPKGVGGAVFFGAPNTDAAAAVLLAPNIFVDWPKAELWADEPDGWAENTLACEAVVTAAAPNWKPEVFCVGCPNVEEDIAAPNGLADGAVPKAVWLAEAPNIFCEDGTVVAGAPKIFCVDDARAVGAPKILFEDGAVVTGAPNIFCVDDAMAVGAPKIFCVENAVAVGAAKMLCEEGAVVAGAPKIICEDETVVAGAPKILCADDAAIAGAPNTLCEEGRVAAGAPKILWEGGTLVEGAQNAFCVLETVALNIFWLDDAFTNGAPNKFWVDETVFVVAVLKTLWVAGAANLLFNDANWLAGNEEANTLCVEGSAAFCTEGAIVEAEAVNLNPEEVLVDDLKLKPLALIALANMLAFDWSIVDGALFPMAPPAAWDPTAVWPNMDGWIAAAGAANMLPGWLPGWLKTLLVVATGAIVVPSILFTLASVVPNKFLLILETVVLTEIDGGAGRAIFPDDNVCVGTPKLMAVLTVVTAGAANILLAVEKLWEDPNIFVAVLETGFTAATVEWVAGILEVGKPKENPGGLVATAVDTALIGDATPNLKPDALFTVVVVDATEANVNVVELGGRALVGKAFKPKERPPTEAEGVKEIVVAGTYVVVSCILVFVATDVVCETFALNANETLFWSAATEEVLGIGVLSVVVVVDPTAGNENPDNVVKLVAVHEIAEIDITGLVPNWIDVVDVVVGFNVVSNVDVVVVAHVTDKVGMFNEVVPGCLVSKQTEAKLNKSGKKFINSTSYCMLTITSAIHFGKIDT